MNERAFRVMTMWAENFRGRQPEHYVFPSEKRGAAQFRRRKKAAGLPNEGIGSSARTRTWNPSVNSRMLYH